MNPIFAMAALFYCNQLKLLGSAGKKGVKNEKEKR
jgi:hypothetical protein